MGVVIDPVKGGGAGEALIPTGAGLGRPFDFAGAGHGRPSPPKPLRVR
jgi:hypothetical protein